MQSAHGTIFTAQEQRPPTDGVRQDKVAPKSYRAWQYQPAARPDECLSRQMMQDSGSPQRKKHSTKRQTEATTIWLPLPLKAEAQRVSGQLGLSVSALGTRFFEVGLRQNIITQQATLLEPLVEKAMRTQANRQTEFLVLIHLGISQLQRMLYNGLARLPDNRQMSEENLNNIMDESANAAHKEVRQRLVHLRTLFENELHELFGKEDTR